MSEDPNLMSNVWPIVPSGATDWLLELCGDGLTGFMPPAMPDAVWVLNAMYEHEQGPADVSYDEYGPLTTGCFGPFAHPEARAHSSSCAMG